MIQKHTFANSALLSGLAQRKEAHQRDNDAWRGEIGDTEAQLAKLTAILMERKSLVTEAQAKYPGTSTPFDLENTIKSKTKEQHQAEAKLAELKVATQKKQKSQFHQLVDMSGIDVDFDNDEHVVLKYKEKEHKLDASTLTQFQLTSLF